jgi:hypothetical protein
MTLSEQRRKALELLGPPPSRRHECLRDIEYALDWVSGPARTAFKIFGSKEGRAGLRRYASALRRALAAYQNLHPRIRPWFSITETAYIVGQPTHLHREIEKAEAILDRPWSSSRAAQHKAAVAMAHNLLSWHGHRATTTRGGKWAQLAGILTGDQKVDLFDHLCAFKRRPGPTVEKLPGARAILYWTRR